MLLFLKLKLIDINECDLKVDECQVNSYCMNTPGSYRCKCKPGFIGNGLYCQDINECDLNISKCMKNSYCINTIGSYTCRCKKGYKYENNACLSKMIRS